MDKVLEYLGANQKRFVSDLAEYVRIPSVSAQPQHQKDMVRAAEWLLARAKAIGLRAEIKTTKGHPVVLARTFEGRPRKPHYLLYGHYDVQPPEPFDLWKTSPFEPRIAGGFMYGRGASDNKGQHLAHLNAVEAYLKTGTELPVDLTFLVEGEEEVGSKNLSTFLQKEKARLNVQAVVISDTGMPSLELPAITCALRGIIALEVTVTGPDRDLHSGIFGGTVDNPALVLAEMLATVRDKKGRIRIEGFYDGVVPLSKRDRAEIAKVGFEREDYKKLLGVPELRGEEGFTPNEQRSARPTFEINGMTSGYQGEGSKTIIPSWARAKITCRLVANQSPQQVLKRVEEHLRAVAPPTVSVSIKGGHGGDPYMVSSQNPRAKAALRALQAAFGAEPILLREGGSIPIVNDFKKILGVETLLLGLALPEDNAHSPNERFSLEAYRKGMRMGALLWQELTRETA